MRPPFQAPHTYRFFLLISLVSLGIIGCSSNLSSALNPSLAQIQLPPGFKISIYADNLPGARSLVLSPNGTLFVSTRDVGSVYAVRDTDGDGETDKKWIIAEGLTMPNGVALKDGNLYVAEVSRVLRYDDVENHLGDPPAPVVVSTAFPTAHAHGWKFIAFGPDGKLYVPVGAPGNNVLEDDPLYAAIWRMDADGGNLELFASGVRNTVGFAWDPATGDLWFTDNGRDGLGDDIPSDELNYAPVKGLHFGYPYLHSKEVVDPVYGKMTPPKAITLPKYELGAHVAALGMRFYTGSMFPAKYRGGIFIAEHGSWNRSKKVGYRVVFIKVEGDKAVSQEVFASGWLDSSQESVSGRPVDVLVMPDGALLVSDDKAGVVYRVEWER